MNDPIALLVMDMQPSILKNLPDASGLIANVQAAISFARRSSIAVIYVRVGFRPGFPEVSPRNKSFSTARERWSGIPVDEFLEIHPAVKPEPNEAIVTKRRISAFTGSDLEVLLRAGQNSHLVLTGISTSGVVLSTVREAADRDYQLTVLSDACADPDEEVHHILTRKVFPRQADVMETGSWIH